MASPTRFERVAYGLGNRCSIHLSYESEVPAKDTPDWASEGKRNSGLRIRIFRGLDGDDSYIRDGQSKRVALQKSRLFSKHLLHAPKNSFRVTNDPGLLKSHLGRGRDPHQ